MASVYHVLYVDAWDEEKGEARGGGYCCGDTPHLMEVPRLMAQARRDAHAMGWGPGGVIVTDQEHRRVRNPCGQILEL